jgi:hypothetical protein
MRIVAVPEAGLSLDEIANSTNEYIPDGRPANVRIEPVCCPSTGEIAAVA